MLRKLLVGVASTALLLGGPSVAVANADEPADCGAATAVLTSAQRAYDDAKAADDKFAEAEKADDALRDARRDLRDAEEKLAAANGDLAAKQAFLKTQLGDDAKFGTEDDLPGAADAKASVDAAQKKVDNLTGKRDDRQKAVNRAEKAARGDVGDLRRKADKTDAEALKKDVDAAQDDVNRLCGGESKPSATPKPEDDIDCDEVSGPEAQRILDADRNDPNNLDIDNDGIACDVDEVPVPADPAPADPGVVVNNNVAVPSGGVATGGGPAWAFE